MLSPDQHEAILLLDRLLMIAKDNETVADLLDQTLNVARMIDPKSERQVHYGPLQRMYFDWQNAMQRIAHLEQQISQMQNPNKYAGIASPPLGPFGTPYSTQVFKSPTSDQSWNYGALGTTGLGGNSSWTDELAWNKNEFITTSMDDAMTMKLSDITEELNIKDNK